MIFKLGELFCGPGGMALGAINAQVAKCKIVHAWANDFHKDSCETYIRNISNNKQYSVIHKDVRELDINSLTPIDAFAFGFPCNDFSIVGEQKGFYGEYGPLYSYGTKVIDKFKPKFFVAENVGGLASANEGKAFQKILNDLSQAGNGYNITAHLYKAEDYGIPQTRHRIIIVGIDCTLNKKFKVPIPTTKGNPTTALQALEYPKILPNAFNHEIKSMSPIVVERLKQIKAGENVWTAQLDEHLRLKVKGAKLSQIYKRLHPNKPSYTITGSGGGGTHGYHWSENRALTNRERARIQTFPDSFFFHGSKESVRKQIGMAVPPKLSEIIFTSILKTLSNIKYTSIEESFLINNKLVQQEIF